MFTSAQVEKQRRVLDAVEEYLLFSVFRADECIVTVLYFFFQITTYGS